MAACLALSPYLTAAFLPGRLRGAWRVPGALRLLAPAILCLPYTLVAGSFHRFRWTWFALYAALPVCIAWMLERASRRDPEQRGEWRDFLVLAFLGLAVDLRWFERAWPRELTVFNKLLLLDAAIYGFFALRALEGVGFDLRVRGRDLVVGLREFLCYAPLAIPLGLGLGFLHLHALWPRPASIVAALLFTFFLIAAPEELFFRGWLQNLLERRIGRGRALLLTSVLFGLAHWNKRAVRFHWRYVLLAAIAGVFYGRAWRAERRVGASTVTHALVDTIWSLWMR